MTRDEFMARQSRAREIEPQRLQLKDEQVFDLAVKIGVIRRLTGRLLVRLVGISCAMIGLALLERMVGYELGYWPLPEVGDALLFAACFFGTADGIRVAFGKW